MADRPELMAVGVEEEFHTVDLETHRLLPRADSLLEQLPAQRFGAELQRSVVETNSRPFVRLIDLAEDLAALRRGVVAAAEPLGLGIVAAGTVPVVDLDALKVTPDPRYENMLEEYQALAREQLICGAQVHVDVGDRDLAVAVAHRVGPWLPALLAVSASSPYWLGSDTGYASYRTLLWSRWPTTGPVGPFESAREYDRLLDDLVKTGVISDQGMIYFDVRPSAHLPTVELRICDACPRVEDVVLLAGLFRALVIRELDAIASGAPARPVRTELVRAAAWRAARSGLEGELVDPVSGGPMPAGAYLRGLLSDLRPTLERTDDWELVAELTEAALAGGGSAARQRAAFAGGGLGDVVELLLAETRANTEWMPGAGPARQEVTTMLAGYRAEADEAVLFDGSARGPYGMIMTALDRIGIDGLRERERQRDEVQRQLGMTFHVDGEQQDRLFPFDVIPRVIAAEDWTPLQAGLSQRVRALEAFLHDAYGERAAVKDGVLPDWIIKESPGLRPDGRFVPRSAVRCAVAGIDLVRDGAGRWAVLEDNLRVPSGLGYALANRWLAARVLPELVRASHTPAPARALSVLRTALTGASPALALVTLGEEDSAFYEHRLLAREMSIPLATPDRLLVTAEGLRIDDDERTPVEVLYRRIDEDELFDAIGADGRPLGPGLLAAVEQGTLTLANAPGNGVGDDKALYAYVPQLIEYYLGERPLLDIVPTYLCRDAEQRAQVLDRLDELVVKPVDGYGGNGVVIGPDASAAELDEVRERILAEPARWIAQETVRLSTHPTFTGDRFEPRAVDLRAFVVRGRVDAEPAVVPVALTRVAPAGSKIVNSSQGGGSKDTWLMQ
ncbi:carboxylate--amine ligase/circularly permuted type 2 ATP-grasp protein [Actinomadura sp. HBU206391]|uniref:carboxylate--amine ligase/circularly permuted type 2 ATP-grasp protein n=1 Tax=Actinomadura sp. HBU206391 TaxID=2731692 RepID=UPI001650A7A5|nr:carboxylate--amine ligase/circularly permuted type 2 ATP-grasp protein [Actinomadura sp. HBU206391]MBC6458387.1 carboxylate--amine ligase/circularly permuted type 2 ATP-grasp protein [Actinomadura sp. HBU206391]